jgi:putative membrane protein
MKSFAIKVLVNGIAIWVTTLLVSGITLGNEGAGTERQLVTLLWVSVIFGVINALIKPVMTILSLPVIVLTLGLFALIVNAAMLELTSWFAAQFGLQFHVESFFWDAVIGAIVITIVTMLVNLVVPDNE